MVFTTSYLVVTDRSTKLLLPSSGVRREVQKQQKQNTSVCFPLCSYIINTTEGRRSQLSCMSEDAPFNSQWHCFGK